MARTTKPGRSRELQRTFYRAADTRRRLHALYDKVVRSDVLERAWGQVRANGGAAGIDRQAIAQVERYSVLRLLDELAADLRAGSYRPLPARRVLIPKRGSDERRPLSIPAVRDRVVQAALRIVIEPIFEADMLECSFGFRPRRSHDALQALIDRGWDGRRWVVETDIANCFEAIPHDRLMTAIKERIVDRHILKLLRALLRRGVAGHDGYAQRDRNAAGRRDLTASVQRMPAPARGAVDRARPRGAGALRRRSDVMCHTKDEAEAALATLRHILGELGLQLEDAKTRMVHLGEGGEGLLGACPRRPAYLFSRSLALAPGDAVRPRPDPRHDRSSLAAAPGRRNHAHGHVFLRGWAGYFRYANSARHFDTISNYAAGRLALHVAKRHKRSRGYGWSVLASHPTASA